MLALEFMAYSVTRTVKLSVTTRMASSSLRSRHLAHHGLQDVLGEGDRGREQRRRGAALDGGEQGAEEHHLGEQGRVFSTSRGRISLRIGVDQAGYTILGSISVAE